MILITDEMIQAADAVLDAAEGVPGATEQAIREAFDAMEPEAKRELASQLLRPASDDEGYSEGQDDRRG